MENTVITAPDLVEKIKEKIDKLNEEAWSIHIWDPHRGLELSSEAKDLAEQYSYNKGLAYAIRNMGVSNRYLSNLETALSLSFQALEMFVELGEKSGEAQAYVSIGAIYYYMGDMDRSLDYFLKGINYNEEVGDKRATAYGYNGAGYIYAVLGNHKKGLEFLQKALALTKELPGGHDLQASIADSLATVFVKDGQFDKAYEAFQQCMHFADQANHKINKAYALLGIGDLFERQDRLEEARECFLQSLSIRREIGYKVGEANSLFHLGRLLLKQENYGKAKEYLLESLKVAEEIKAKAVIYEVHEALAELFEGKGDIQSFVKHYKLYHKIKSEVFKDEQETKQKYLNMQHEMDRLKHVSVLSRIGKDITSTLDLDTILNTVYENVNQLMDATIFGIGIYKPEEQCIEYRLSIEEGKRYQPYKRMMSDKSQLAVWCIENSRDVFINDISTEFRKYLTDIDFTVPKAVVLEDGSTPQNPTSVIYLPLQVKDKTIGLISVQSYAKNAYSQYHLDILKTLASYTSAALYNARSFESLQNTLNTLKLTQEQLVQSEKMASLGELTAGIAHEIQNPLNFVNNFSEVNKELLNEMKDALAMGNMEEVKAIANDVIENEEKILHHGKRADGIVKGMLQHSRTSSGKKEPTDIKALCDEYLRLSYHGLRAKDKNFNATIKTDFDDSIGNINIIPQDIGRVILNLINNAFYAASLPPKGGFKDPAYRHEPTVWVSTKKLGDKVLISVRDNGPGIPEEILNKIFQPFFTTKPTGQGTGLGLSLSYDIVKAHGGELSVETKEGEARPDDPVGRGSTFKIQLPG